MKSIELFIDGEEKTFTTPFVSGMVWRKYIEWKAKVANLQNLTADELDELAGLVVFAFGNQFSLEDFYNGVPHDQVMIKIDELFLPTDEGTEGNEKK